MEEWERELRGELTELTVNDCSAEALPLSEWATVESQCRHRLAAVDARLRRLRVRLEAEARAFRLEDGNAEADGVLHRLSFLQADAVTLAWRAAGDELGCDATSGGCLPCHPDWHEVPTQSLAAAEWNALLEVAGGECISGRVGRLGSALAAAKEKGEAATAQKKEVADYQGCKAAASPTPSVLIASECEVAGDYCAAAWRAHSLGAVALLIACDSEVTRPMAYGSEQLAPPIPAAMLPRSTAEALLAAEGGAGGAVVRLRVLRVAAIEEDAAGGGGGIDEGLMADVVALDDATSQKEHGRLVALQSERERLVASLRFASHVQRQLTIQNKEAEASCPICLEPCTLRAVLPDCFHSLCSSCLQRASGGNSAFNCPLCRTRVKTWTVTVFHTEPTQQEGAPMVPAGLAMPRGAWRRLPTKLQRLVTLVHSLLAADPDERVLIYTQWLAHVEYLGETLRLAGLPALKMSGDLGASMRSLARFGREPTAPRILLLSSQHHASGINLQCARNLIIVHPYCTPSASEPEAVSFAALQAFEQQAIGRIRRYPQRETVRVYRLFATESVEEGLYRGGYSENGRAGAAVATK